MCDCNKDLKPGVFTRAADCISRALEAMLLRQNEVENTTTLLTKETDHLKAETVKNTEFSEVLAIGLQQTQDEITNLDLPPLVAWVKDLMARFKLGTWRHGFRVAGSHSTGVYSNVQATNEPSGHAHLFMALEDPAFNRIGGVQLFDEQWEYEGRIGQRVSLIGLDANAVNLAGFFHNNPYPNIAAQYLFDADGKCVGSAQGMDAVPGAHRVGTASHFIAITEDSLVVVKDGVSRPI